MEKPKVIQLLKGEDTSELSSLKFIPNIEVHRLDKNYGFIFSMSKESKKEMIEHHNQMLNYAYKLMCENKIDMLIIDEFNAAYKFEVIDKEIAEKIVLNKPKKIELILTGRDPEPRFVDAADYVSEIKCIKHPYDKLISARKGIEY